jgi:hypothetical protein
MLSQRGPAPRTLARAPSGARTRRGRLAKGPLQYSWDHFPTIEDVRQALIDDPDVLVRDLESCRVVQAVTGAEGLRASSRWCRRPVPARRVSLRR